MRLQLPRSLAVLGECAFLLWMVRGVYRSLNLEAGHVLCANPDPEWGVSLWVLRPLTAEHAPGGRRQMVRAAELHERFVQRDADAYFNCEVRAVRKPHYCGELVMITYVQEKTLDSLATGEEGEAMYQHTFEGPNGLAFPHLFQVGSGQFWIPPGPYQVTGRGIHFAKKENLYGQIKA